jgi:multidrug efflux system outer membrane protein
MYLPGISYNSAADRGKNASLGNAYTAGGGTIAEGFDAYLSATWELDFWGRVRKLNEEAKAQYLASNEARKSLTLSLISSVANAYYDLLELDEELTIAKNSYSAFEESLHLFNRRMQAGVSSRLESASAEAAMAASAAKIPEIERLIAYKENELSVLLGQKLGLITHGGQLDDASLLADVPTGLSSSLLERRPDVRAAEELAIAANAHVGVTLGGFLPRIGLSSILGAVSPSLNSINNEKAQLWSIGLNGAGPVFEGGGLIGQYRYSKQNWEEAKSRYQQVALNAFADAANALVNRQKLKEMRIQKDIQVRALMEQTKLAKERYIAGKSNYLEVIQAQEQLYPAESSLAQTKRDQFKAVIQLYKALGGGWNI